MVDKDELTAHNLHTKCDEIISKWTKEDWQRFEKRWLHTLWPIEVHGTQSARASIPLQAGDDDIILGRLVDFAKERFGVS